MKRISSFLTIAVAGILAAGVAHADNVYVTSNGSSSIEEIIDGTVTQFVSNSPDLFGPTGIALDSQGNVYVANNGQPGAGFVAEFSPSGAFVGNVATGLWNPRGIVFDSAGNLFIANQSAGFISEVPAGGGVQSVVVTGLSFPNGLSFDAAGNLYVVNGSSQSVDKITFSGGNATSTPFITSGLSNPNGVLAITSGIHAGDIMVVDKNASAVFEYDSAGNLLPGNPFIADANPADGPKYIAVDSAGDFYVTDSNDDMVTEYSPDGSILAVFKNDANGNKAFVGACGIVTQQLVVPEPSTYALLFAGLGMLFFVSRRKRVTA